MKLALLVAAVAWPALAAAQCRLQVRPVRGDGVSLDLPLPASQRFTLAYLHSVTRTWVRETLRADSQGLVQLSIAFSVPGPGLPTEALPGEAFRSSADGFAVDGMHRRIGPLAMRVDPSQHQTLELDGMAYPLTTDRPAALLLQARGCE